MTRSANHRTAAEQDDCNAFARKLDDLMARKGMSQSDVARALWGTVMDNRGREVARNRDRISHYVRGSQMPEAKTLRALAELFGVDVAELAPGSGVRPVGANLRAPPPDVSMVAVAGQTGYVLLQINKQLSLGLAVKIMSLLADDKS